MREEKETCTWCNGSGKKYGNYASNESCDYCNGYGYKILQYDDSSSGGSSSGGSSGPNIGDRFLSKQKEAFASYRNNDIDTALKLCNDALEMYKPYMSKNGYYAKFVAQTYNLRGVCHQEKGNIELAISDFKVAADFGSEDAEKNLSRLTEHRKNGYSFIRSGEYDKAIAEFTEAIKFLPSDYESYQKRGFCYGSKKEYDKAIVDLDKAISLNSKDGDVYFDRIKINMGLGKWDKAEADYKQAANLKPIDTLKLLLFARTIRDEFQNPKIAALYYQRVIEMDKSGEDAEYAKKELAELQAQTASSSQQIGDDRSEADELFEKAYAADKAENNAEAIRCFKQVAKLIGADPSNLENLVEAFYQKGVELQKTGDVSEAITFYGGACFFDHEEAKKALEKIASKGKGGGFLGGLFRKK